MTVQQTTKAPQIYRHEELQELFGIKRASYYSRLKRLGIEAHKNEQGKPYLDQVQFEAFKALHEHINNTGKMDGFVNTNTVTLATTEQTNIEVSPEEIYTEPEDPISQFDLNSLLRSAAELKAREIAMPALLKRAIADQITEDDLPEDLKEKVNLVREAANPKLTPAEIATQLLNKYRGGI
jgi:hypothetical protein